MPEDITGKLNAAISKALSEEQRQPPHLELGGIFDMILAFIEKIMTLCPMASPAQVKAYSKLARQPVRGIFARARMAKAIKETASGLSHQDAMLYVNVVARVGADAKEDDIEQFMAAKENEFVWE